MAVITAPAAAFASLEQTVTGLTLPRLQRMRAAYVDELNTPRALRLIPLRRVRRALALVECEIRQRVRSGDEGAPTGDNLAGNLPLR